MLSSICSLREGALHEVQRCESWATALHRKRSGSLEDRLARSAVESFSL